MEYILGWKKQVVWIEKGKFFEENFLERERERERERISWREKEKKVTKK